MIFRLFRRTPQNPTIAAIYGTIVAQARLPCFYSVYGVSDTVEGRFEMIVLHLALVLRRLAGEPEICRPLFDRFCLDMDHNLRELGVSDLGVPRKMREFAEAYYGRAAAYDRALAVSEAALASTVARNVFGSETIAPAAIGLASYIRDVATALDGLPADQIHRLRFPMPDVAEAVAKSGGST